ncbi:hypothetical protein B0H66DRAFT_252714 [Apodospora peruviana]|uniref:Uncharacterized protein n=1 Tax=Apodospora peruviana TaxID=516989 RepID=A0AAE0I5U4_9PEZI|nr:hypothetical protein B0H66DRAFT_252714 [Apodospora peruviana]
MDWADTISPLLAADETLFTYDEQPETSSRVLQLQREDGKPKVIVLDNGQSWKNWSKSTPSGYDILLCSRAATRANESDTGISALTFGFKHWKDATQRLYVHKSIAGAVQGTSASPPSEYITTKIGGARAVMYTAGSCPHVHGGLAVSSTYFPDQRLTTGVIFGCGRKEMDRVQDLLKKSEATDHPFLMTGVFTELQRQRLQKALDFVIDTINDVTSGNKIKDGSDLLIWGKVKGLRTSRLDVAQLEEEIRATRCQVQKLISLTNDRSWGLGDCPNCKTARDCSHCKETTARYGRYRERFEDICIEYEAMMSRCRIYSDTISFTRDLWMAELARLESKDSSKQAKYSTGMAIIASLFLPGSTFATIMAMPIFNYEANWRDMSFKPSEKSNTPVSGWLWIWFAFTAAGCVFSAFVFLSYTGKLKGFLRNLFGWNKQQQKSNPRDRLTLSTPRKLPARRTLPTAPGMSSLTTAASRTNSPASSSRSTRPLLDNSTTTTNSTVPSNLVPPSSTTAFTAANVSIADSRFQTRAGRGTSHAATVNTVPVMQYAHNAPLPSGSAVSNINTNRSQQFLPSSGPRHPGTWSANRPAMAESSGPRHAGTWSANGPAMAASSTTTSTATNSRSEIKPLPAQPRPPRQQQQEAANPYSGHSNNGRSYDFV